MDVEELLAQWPGREVLMTDDEATGATIIIAIHSLRAGRAIGGTRVKTYPRLSHAVEDAQRLATGMALKWAAAGIEAGGGKAVIAIPSGLSERDRGDLLRRFGEVVAGHGGRFLTGPDLGTTSEDMDIIAETAPGYVFGRTQQAGGGGNPAPFTAAGVFTAMQVVSERLFGAGGLAGLRVLLQGMGQVAQQLVPLLREQGAGVMFSDIDPEVTRRYTTHGLDFVSPELVAGTDCEIFAPCAIGGTLNAGSIPHLRCAAVVGAANNQLAKPEDAERLRRRNILYAPDFVANSGGAIGLIGMETGGMSRYEAMDAVKAAVRRNLGAILDAAERDEISTDLAARRLAESMISETITV